MSAHASRVDLDRDGVPLTRALVEIVPVAARNAATDWILERLRSGALVAFAVTTGNKLDERIIVPAHSWRYEGRFDRHPKLDLRYGTAYCANWNPRVIEEIVLVERSKLDPTEIPKLTKRDVCDAALAIIADRPPELDRKHRRLEKIVDLLRQRDPRFEEAFEGDTMKDYMRQTVKEFYGDG